MSRGDRREHIVRSNEDYALFIRVVVESVKRFNILIHSYCLMANHYHLLVETPDSNLASAMRHINGVYTQRYNVRNKTVGHVFQGRYKAILVEKDEYLLSLCRYIERNPVRAGIVEHPVDYTWSSYRTIAGIDDKEKDLITTDWVLSQFAKSRGMARKRYIEYILSPDADDDKPFESVKGSCFLGSKAFVSQFSDEVWDKEDLKEFTQSQRNINRPPLSVLLPQWLPKQERDIRAYEAVYDFGYHQREVADHLDLHYAYISRVIARVRERLNSKT